MLITGAPVTAIRDYDYGEYDLGAKEFTDFKSID